jgi:hypothetical protein
VIVEMQKHKAQPRRTQHKLKNGSQFATRAKAAWAPEPAERGPPAQASDWPRNAVIPITYRPVPDIA